MHTQNGACPLRIASQKGHDRIVEIFLQAGATVDLQDKVEIVICSYVIVVPCRLLIIH